MINYITTPPQANNLERVIGLLNKADDNGEFNIEEDYFSHIRDKSYYLGALSWLGFIEKRQNAIFLTQEGINFRNLNATDRVFRIRKILLSDSVFNIAHRYKSSDHNTLKKIITKEIRKPNTKWLSKGKILSETTANRRASTVISWSKEVALIPQKRQMRQSLNKKNITTHVVYDGNLQNDNLNQLEKIYFAIKELTKSEKPRNSFTVGEITNFCKNKWPNWRYLENKSTTVGSAVRRCLQHHCSDTKYGGKGGARTAIGLKKGDEKDIFKWEKEEGLWSIRSNED